jgi:WD40 repeat protein
MAFTLRRTIGAHQAEVLCAAWSPDGSLLATGGADAAIQVRAFETGEIQRTIREHRNAVSALAFSHDGLRLASGSLDGTVVISSVARGMLVRRFVYTEPVRQVAFSPDDALVAAASPEDNVRLWEVETGDIHSELRVEKSHADAFAWSPWNTIATGSFDGTVRIWDPQTGTVKGRLPAGGERPTCVAFLPDEGFVAGYASGLLRIVTARVGLVDLRKHSSRIVGLTASARGDRIATRSADGLVRLWSTRSWDVTDRIKDPPTHAVHAPVCFHPEEDVLATSSEDKKSMRIWNLAHRYATIPPPLGLPDAPPPPELPASEFDVFVCYNSADAEEVKKIVKKLKESGVRPFLYERDQRPGVPWLGSLGEAIERINAAAVCVGNNSIGVWQDLEIEAYLREVIQRRCPVIPVILPDCVGTPPMPLFLRGMHWVDFRKNDPPPIDQLIYGITGRRMLSEG